MRIRRGAYAAGEVWRELSPEGRHRLLLRAVLLRLGPLSAASHHSAAVLHGLRLHGVALAVVHVTHPTGHGSARREGGVQHHQAQLPDEDVVRTAGLRTTSPLRSALDLARLVAHPTGVCAIDGVLAGGVARSDLLAQHVRTLDWPGSRAAGRALAEADGGSESVGETLQRLELAAVGWKPEVLQHPIRTELGTVRTDFAWPQRRLAGEFDGRVKYERLLRPGESASDVVVRERRRELAIERAGWCVVRFTWSGLHDREALRRQMADAARRAERYAS
ncbi:MAG TPA: hypothetical protein VF661_12440 [Actinomycetales bacterium]